MWVAVVRKFGCAWLLCNNCAIKKTKSFFFGVLFCCDITITMSFSSRMKSLQVEKASPKINNDNLLSSSWDFYFGGKKSSTTATTTSSETASKAKAEQDAQLSYGDRFKGFSILIVSSGCFFMIAFAFLPTAILFPGKFALAFTIGSLMFMGSFAFLRGPMTFLKGMLSRDQLPFAMSYICSLVMTIYSCIVAKSYFLVLGSAIFQIAALMWYASSFLPGGTYGMKIFTAMFCRTIKTMAGPCFQFCKATCSCCFRSSGSLLPT